MRRCLRPLLFAVIALSALLVQAQAPRTMPVNSGQAHPEILACLGECSFVQNFCTTTNKAGLLCSDRNRICVERCDPSRLTRESILALYPPSSNVIAKDWKDMTPGEQHKTCVSNCTLSASTCTSTANSNQGGGQLIGGKNQESSCSLAVKGCTARCGPDPAGVTEPESAKRQTQRALEGNR